MWRVAAALGGASFLQGVGNYFLQKDTLDWQKEAQKTTWEREDTAVQRRAKDLEAAGLSKTLAAGGSAQTSGPINVTTPQFEGVSKGVDTAAAALNLMRQKADIARTYAETGAIELQGKLAVAQAQKATQETNASVQMTPLLVRQASQMVTTMGIDAAKKEVDIQAAKLGIDQAKVDLVKAEISKDVANKTAMRSAEIDIISKKVAIEIEQLNRDKGWHDFAIYKNLGLPTGQSLGTLEKAGILTGTALGNLIKKAGEYRPQNETFAPGWAQDAIKGRK